jgi:hypothetical protein
MALTSGLLLVAVPGNAEDGPTQIGNDKKAQAKKALAQKLEQKGEHHHPSHIHAALHELKEARHELRESHPNHDFGGRKIHALKAVDHAIHELELLIEHHPETKKHEAAQNNNSSGTQAKTPAKDLNKSQIKKK